MQNLRYVLFLSLAELPSIFFFLFYRTIAFNYLQCGKTGVYLQMIGLFREQIECTDEEVDDEDSDPEDDEAQTNQSQDEFKAVVPYWKEFEKLEMPKNVSNSKYTRMTGRYAYPVEIPPDFPGWI